MSTGYAAEKGAMVASAGRAVGRLARAVAGAALLLLAAADAGQARLAEPDVIYEGFAKDAGVVLTSGKVTLTINGATDPAATCRIGANPALGGRFALAVPMDAVDPRTPGSARPGDTARIFVDGALAGVYLVPDRGTVVHLTDVDKDFGRTGDDQLPVLWSRLHPGDDGSGDINGNGETDLDEWLAGSGYGACVWTPVAADPARRQTCVFHPVVLRNCLADAGGDYLHNEIAVVAGTYAAPPDGAFAYRALPDEDYDLALAGGYRRIPGEFAAPQCAPDVVDPGLTVLDGQGQAATLVLDAASAATAGAIRVANLALVNGKASVGGGLSAATAGGALSISGVLARGNEATAAAGGIFAATGSGALDVVNTFVVGNAAPADAGLAVATLAGTVRLVHDTVADNPSVLSGAGLSLALGTPAAAVDVVSSVVHGNTRGAAAADVAVTGTGALRFIADDIGDAAGIPAWATRSGLIAADPLFRDRAAGDYRLVTASPCLGVGDGAYVPRPAVDFEGSARGASPDLGADEHLFNALTVTVGNKYGTVTSTPAGIAACTDATCSALFGDEITVTLTATPIPGSILKAFTGCDAVSGFDCTVALAHPRAVSVEFQDVTSPDVALSSAAADPTRFSPIPVTVTFSEEVVGFGLGSLTVAGGTAGNLVETVAGTTWTVEVTPDASGTTVTVDVAAGAVADPSGNPCTAAAQLRRSFDDTPPTAALSSASPDPTNASPVPVTVTFSEPVVGFGLGSLAVSGGAAANLLETVPGTAWTLEVTPAASIATVTVAVPAGAVADPAGNLNPASGTLARSYDRVPPTVVLATVAPDPTNTKPIPVTVTFSEPVVGFGLGRVTVTGGSAGNLVEEVPGTAWTIAVTPDASGTTVTVAVAAGAVHDPATNPNLASNVLSRLFDDTPPSAVLASTTTDRTNVNPIPVTVTFSEPVIGFGPGSLTVTGGAAGNLSETVPGTAWSLEVTPSGNETPVSVELAAGVVHDPAANPNTAAAPLRRYYETTRPVVTIATALADPTNVSPLTFTVSFNEPVTGLETGDFIMGNGTILSLTPAGDAFTLVVRPAAIGLVSVDLPDGAVRDLAGNASLAASRGITYDDVRPVSSIRVPVEGAVMIATAFSAVGTAADVGTGLSRVEVSLDGGAWFTAIGEASWRGLLDGLAEGEHTVRSRAVDRAGNVEDPGPVVRFSVHAGAPQEVVVAGRQLLVEGRPYAVKGVVYAPVPIGEDPALRAGGYDYFTPDHDALNARHLPQVRRLNANTVRLLGWQAGADHVGFLDLAWNGGVRPLRVIPDFPVPPGLDLGDPAVRERLRDEFRGMVASHKEHPAILLWSIGAGLNAPAAYGSALPELFSLLGEMTAAAREEDPGHPVAVNLADVDLAATVAAYDAALPALGLWGAEVHRGGSFGTLFDDFAAASPRPLLLLGFGVDAFDTVRKREYERYTTAVQADFDGALWGEIAARADVSPGGVVREYVDEWHLARWSTDGDCPEDVDPAYHGRCGRIDPGQPDGYANDEWWGLVRRVVDPADPEKTEPRKAFARLQRLFWDAAWAVLINGLDEHTASRAVRLALNAPPGTKTMCLSNGTSCSDWKAYDASVKWTLSAGDGVKTVRAWFRNADGRGNKTPYTDAINLDATAPENLAFTATAGFEQVDLAWSFADAGIGIAGYTLVVGAGAAPASCDGGTVLSDGPATEYRHGGLTNGVVYHYRVCATDRLGNRSAGAVAIAQPRIEFVPPAGSVVINGGAAATRSRSATLDLAAGDDHGVAAMCLSNTPSCAAGGWRPFAATASWTLSAGDGVKTVHVWFRDGLGNVSAAPSTDGIVFDTTAPVGGRVAALPGNGRVRLDWSGFSDAGSGIGFYRVVYSKAATPASCKEGSLLGTFDALVPGTTHLGLVNGKTYYYRVCAIDRVGILSGGVAVKAKPVLP